MLQICISTMFLKDPKTLLKKMKIESDAIIIDQTDYEKHEVIKYKNYVIDIYHTTERGLSKSRNKALENATSDYLIIADDDFEYSNDYQKEIINNYLKHPNADIIVFNAMKSDGLLYRIFPEGRLKRKYRYSLNSVRITLKRQSIIDSSIMFDEKFGAGSIISTGEDTIFVSDCIKKGLIIYSCDYILCKGIVNDRESTWFKGFTKKYFEDKALVYKRISPKFYFMLIFYFLIKHYNYYKDSISFFKALKIMFLANSSSI